MRRSTSILMQQHRALFGAAMESYVTWREAAAAVRVAYQQWAAAFGSDSRLAFMAYEAALGREETAAKAYENRMTGLARAASADDREQSPDLPTTFTPWF